MKIPDGWKLVPISPTPEMLSAPVRYGDSEGFGRVDEYDAERVWDDMIAAAPPPPVDP